MKKEDVDKTLKRYEKELAGNNITIMHTDGKGQKMLEEYEKIELITRPLPTTGKIEYMLASEIAKNSNKYGNVKLREWSIGGAEDEPSTPCEVFSVECQEIGCIEIGIRNLIDAQETLNEKIAKAAKFIYRL